MEFTDPALQGLAEMKKPDRRLVLDGIRLHLIDNNPTEITRNKFPLRRPSQHAERELRLGNWRVFYSVIEDELVLVNLIGEKRDNKLVIGGEDFEL